MSRLDNQRRLFLELIETLRPHWRRDPGLPARIQRWLAAHRAGSRDRRLYRELAYTALRVLPWIENAPPDVVVGIVAASAAPSAATEAFIAQFKLAPLPAHCDPGALLPEWLAEECPAALAPEQRAILLSRAPLWIRLQHPNAADAVQRELTAGGWTIARSPALATAWRLEGEGDLTRTAAYRDGHLEVQDIGSQLLLEIVRPSPGEHWLDACAGAGGKTLQLARMVAPTGTVVAHDIRSAALVELERRATRAGVRNLSMQSSPPGSGAVFDGVLVDAPCTGSGTWRRAPHLKWTSGVAAIARAAERQRRLLDQYSAYVKPGARLVYATCSLCRSENEAVVEAFLAAHPEFAAEPLAPIAPLEAGPFGLTILPAALDSDAFFVSAMRRS